MQISKKIGIITLHSLYNCGSMLQTYALSSFLNSIKGVDCEIINYVPASLDNKRAFRIEGALAEKYAKEIAIRNQKFQNFCETQYQIASTKYHTDNEIEKNPPIYDIYVSGSDQIWNANFRIASRAYFLGFTDSPNKFAFAPSVGRCMEEKLSIYRDLLLSYQKIWVRERTGLSRIKNVTGREDIGWMPDPTFLYTHKDYDKIAAKETVYDGNYIACYATLDDQLDMMMPILHKLSKQYDMPVVLIGGVIPREESWIINKVAIGPREFLQAVRDAKMVVTQTFHGTIFSILYNKNFIVFNDAMPNFRKTGILEELGLVGRIVHNANETEQALSSPLDYDRINEKLSAMRQEARNNIITSIQSIEK